MPQPCQPCEHLSRAGELLRRPLDVAAVRRMTVGAGSAIQDEIVTTNRLILITRGELLYTVENRSQTVGAGMQLLVPAWVRRVWSVPQADSSEIVWCEFDSADRENTGMALRKLAAAELRREVAAYGALLRLHRQAPSPWSRLRLEASLKVMLVRFLERAEIDPDPVDAPPSAEIHPQVKAMLRWLDEHFCRKDALAALYARSGLTPNYFRRHFHAATLCAPHDYIERLRLGHARYLLRSTRWQLKRIAAEVGYDDPLHFSRLYRRFWKHPPSAERQALP